MTAKVKRFQNNPFLVDIFQTFDHVFFKCMLKETYDLKF